MEKLLAGTDIFLYNIHWNLHKIWIQFISYKDGSEKFNLGMTQKRSLPQANITSHIVIPICERTIYLLW